MIRRRLFLIAGLAAAAALAHRRAARAETAAHSAAATAMSAHDFAFANIDGGLLRLADYAGRPVLVVNTASFCAFTPQYEGLQALWQRYRDRGLVVVGVPTRDFNQEYGKAAEVKEFCQVNFGIDFPMADLTRVKGGDRHPFYAWAAQSLGEANAPRWNFHKYLIDGEGRAVAAFGTSVRPDAPKLVEAIEKLLPAA